MNWGVLILLTCVNIVNYFDRYIVHSVEPLIKNEFGLSNEYSGLIISAFTIGYLVFSPIIGLFGERLPKPKLMGWGLVVWSLATACGVWAHSFSSFFASRIAVGIGEASFGTVLAAYIKERVGEPVKLTKALSVLYCAIPVGAALGFSLGGVIAARAGWHYMFLFAAVPGLLLAPFVLRLQTIQSTEKVPSGLLSGLRLVREDPVLLFGIGGYIFNTFALNGIASFIVRHSGSLGLDHEVASGVFGGILLVTGFVGSLGGGRIAAGLAAKTGEHSRSMLRFLGYSALCGVPFLGLALLVKSIPLFFAFCFLAELVIFAGTAPINALLVHRAKAGTESAIQGATILLINLFGSILSPYLIGVGADFLESGMPASLALSYSMQLSTLALALSGFIWLNASKRCEPGS